MQLVDLALVLCVMAMWMMMMMMMMSDLADFLFGHLEAVRCWVVDRVVDGRYRGSTVSYRAKRVSCGGCCYSTFVAFPCGRISSLSLSRDRENVFFSGTPTREEVVSYTMDGQTASHAGLLIASPRAPVQFPPQDRYGFLRNRSRRISET